MSYAPPPMDAVLRSLGSNVPSALQHVNNKIAPPTNPELLEASKGPFRQLVKPIALALEDDPQWITPLHCFVRKHCVQVFTATEVDVRTPSKGKRKPIQVGQIGIRCYHCHEGMIDTDPNLERGSVYYPTSLSSIYNATMNLLQRHLRTCPKVPESIMEKYKELKEEDARSGTSKVYWIESARSLGFVDTLHGIRLSAKEPPPPPMTSESQKEMRKCNAIQTDGEDCDDVDTGGESEQQGGSSSSSSSSSSISSERNDGVDVIAKTNGDGTKVGEDEKTNIAEVDVTADETESDKGETKKKEDEGKKEHPSIADPPSLVDPADKDSTTAFSYLLLMQMRPCVFTEADRLGKRKNLPLGFAGLACKHCFGGYGSGRYFPSSIKTISDTSKTLNVLHSHMARCRRVPKDVVDQLEITRSTHEEERGKMKFGSQKGFFAKVWSRLHDNRPDGVVLMPPPRKPTMKTNTDDGLRRLSSTQSASSFGSSQSGGMPIHRWGAASVGMGTNNAILPSQAAMSSHDRAMALVMGGGAGNGMSMGSNTPHSTLQYSTILGGGFDPMMMTQMVGGHSAGSMSMGGLHSHAMTQMLGGGNLSMGGSNHESFASFQHNISQQIFGNGGDGDSERSLEMTSSDTQKMRKRLRLLSSTNIADV